MKTCEAKAEKTRHWDDEFMCELAQNLAELTVTNKTFIPVEDSSGVVVYNQEVRTLWTDWIFRAFHPKSIACSRIGDRIYYYHYLYFW